MSCPELGTLHKDGEGPYDQKVMDTVSELQRIGYVKFGFDRAGTSTAREKDAALFAKAFALRDEGKRDEAIELLKSTDWWYGYQTSVKQAVKLEGQSFDGTLDVICIKGGFITQLEAAEMVNIMADAQSDCAKSGIFVRFTITEVSYHAFLQDYDFLQDYGLQQQSEDGVHVLQDQGGIAIDSAAVATVGIAEAIGEGSRSAHKSAPQSTTSMQPEEASIGELRAALAQQATKLAQKEMELAQQAAELATLRARLQSHGAPPASEYTAHDWL
jgi:hypothetical protein